MLLNSLTVFLITALAAVLAWPLGAYMAKVYKGEKNLLDFLQPAENFLFKVCQIDMTAPMNWKQYLTAFACANLLWFIWGFVILLVQGKLGMNPAGNPSMEWSLALNSAVSFLTSTNIQHYSGETGATYFSQMAVFMFLQFVSAAASLCAGIAVVRGLTNDTDDKVKGGLGNFYVDFVRSCTRILLPLCIIASVLFLVSGVPMTFEASETITTLQGDEVTVATGPVAAFLSIKELGSNGGGFFGPNDAHPFENPNFFSFIIHCVIVFLLPMAFVFMIGSYTQNQKFSRMLFAVMATGFILATLPILFQETGGNPALKAMGIDVSSGNMEGKETRFGSFFTAYYAGINVVIPAGTIAGMHDSFMPLSGITMLLAMQVDAFFGGLGTGWINMFILLIVAVFFGTLMIGRTPELFHKKIGILEIQIAIGITVLQTLVPMGLTAIACFVYVNYPGGSAALGWLNNTGPHGFTTMLYEYVSSAAGNGSGFEGLGDNTVFWNTTTAFAMLCGRFVPLAGAVIIAGLLKEKKFIHQSTSTLKTDSWPFGIFLFFIIIILNALSSLPSLMLGPVSEHFKF